MEQIYLATFADSFLDTGTVSLNKNSFTNICTVATVRIRLEYQRNKKAIQYWLHVLITATGCVMEQQLLRLIMVQKEQIDQATFTGILSWRARRSANYSSCTVLGTRYSGSETHSFSFTNILQFYMCLYYLSGFLNVKDQGV
jgi:hypothetical protein